MSGVGLLNLLDDAAKLLERERRLLLAGSLHPLAGLAAEKQRLLAALEEILPGEDPAPEVRRAFGILVAAARRNETLLAHAREGVAAACRRIAALRATRQGAVAYDRDGAPIRSSSDAWGRTRCA